MPLSEPLVGGLGAGSLALRGLGTLLALGGLRLFELGDAARHRAVREHRLGGSSRNVTPSIAGEVCDAKDRPDLEGSHVDLDVLGDRRRKRLDADLARDLLDDATLLRAGGLADELDGDRRLDRLVEPHLVEVDVRQRARGSGAAGSP